jgi:hypothetical protein
MFQKKYNWRIKMYDLFADEGDSPNFESTLTVTGKVRHVPGDLPHQYVYLDSPVKVEGWPTNTALITRETKRPEGIETGQPVKVTFPYRNVQGQRLIATALEPL